MNKPIIEVKNLSHRYHLQWAIKDISFAFQQKGIYGLLGANGAGKSTLMNIICGVLRQTEGDVYIKGVNLKEHPQEAKKYLGFLPQTPPLQPELTVYEYLDFCANLRLMNKHRIREAVDQVMEKCQISHFSRRLIKNLSGGYQQRVGIAQAIIHQPDFVVLDEPTNGLDPNQILEVRKLIQEIAEEKMVLLSTHILQEVQALCQHIWMLNEGKVVFAGSLAEFDAQASPDSLTVTLLAQPPAEELRQIPGILEAEELTPTRYRLHFNGDRTVIDQFVRTSVSRDWQLVEISPEKNSLNTVFATLTRKNKTS